MDSEKKKKNDNQICGTSFSYIVDKYWLLWCGLKCFVMNSSTRLVGLFICLIACILSSKCLSVGPLF